MARIYYALLFFFLLPAMSLRAQDNKEVKFFTHGKIEFERKENIANQIKSWTWLSDDARKSISEYKVTYTDLIFSGPKSLYKPGREEPQQPNSMELSHIANENVVFCDQSTQQYVSQKIIYEDKYLVSDTLHPIKWRITSGTRTIAGFECHRATTVLMDSVFVVAFYTDEIVASGGPETFGGLPGMILGLDIPKLHTTWYATQLSLIPVKEEDLAPPVKGKKSSLSSLRDLLKDKFKDWGNINQTIWKISI